MKKIKIIAPSSYVSGLTEGNIQPIESFFNKLKYNVCFGKYLFEKHNFLAGNDSKRLSDLETAFADTGTDAIVVLRGGAGCLHLLDKIDYQLISKNPKPLFGFSDTTVLQNALYAKIDLPSFSGFWAAETIDNVPKLTKETLLKCLKNEKQIFHVPFLSSGKVNGTLLGGNLRMFTSLLGTPYFPDMTDKILILEDVGEAPYKIDNMIMQLKLAGVLNKIKGLILGDFSHVGTKTDEKVLTSLFNEYFKDAPYPVARLKQYSHELGHIVIPLGGIVHLDSAKSSLVLDKLKKYRYSNNIS